jgi:ABC-type phosphate transport system substrate-binding protein
MRILFLAAVLMFVGASEAGGLLVIVHPQVPVEKISNQQLADIYALKKSRWSAAVPVVPVNREAGSDERESFSGAVFNVSAQELTDLWDRLRFEGKIRRSLKYQTMR